MMIKLTAVDSALRELWLNTLAISGVLQPSRSEQEVGIGAKVYITGENDPWFVQDSVSRVVQLIDGVERGQTGDGLSPLVR